MRNNLNEFRRDNTNERYSDDELHIMNCELAEILDNLMYIDIEEVPAYVLQVAIEKVISKHVR